MVVAAASIAEVGHSISVVLAGSGGRDGCEVAMGEP